MVSGDNEEEERQVEGDGKGLFRKQLEGLVRQRRQCWPGLHLFLGYEHSPRRITLRKEGGSPRMRTSSLGLTSVIACRRGPHLTLTIPSALGVQCVGAH